MNKKNNETTLTHLTKRFVKLLNSNSERVINLNDASARLSVAKRRIYDITNVLEGIGLLQKTSKNVTKWVDCPKDSAFAAPPSATNTDTNNLNGNSEIKPPDNAGIHLNGPKDPELLALLETYQSLEDGVNELLSTINQQLTSDAAHVTYDDIKSSFKDQTVIAVKVPQEGGRLEVNDQLQISIKSERGQIEVYLYQNYNNNNNNNNNNNSQNNQTSVEDKVDPPPPPPSTLLTDVKGRPTMSSTDVTYYDPTSGFSEDPTLSSAVSIGEDEDPFTPLVAFEGSEEPLYNFLLDESYTIASIFPEDNLGLY